MTEENHFLDIILNENVKDCFMPCFMRAHQHFNAKKKVNKKQVPPKRIIIIIITLNQFHLDRLLQTKWCA